MKWSEFVVPFPSLASFRPGAIALLLRSARFGMGPDSSEVSESLVCDTEKSEPRNFYLILTSRLLF
jgi:hypothetical protein